MATWVLITALLIHLIALPIVARRLWFLFRLARSAQPAPDRIASAGEGIKSVLTEVFGQRRLLKWTIPGLAHFFTFWAFVILGSVYVEAYGILIANNDKWAIPVIGDWWILGFAQDTIALLVLLSLVTFWWIRMKNSPAKLGRQSRFKGSHEFGAYLVLFFIFMVVATMFMFRGAAAALGNFHNSGAYVSNGIGHLIDGLSHGTLEVLEGLGLILHLLVMLVFLIEVVHSKHLHVLVAPLNVLFKRQPIALGAAKPLTSGGKPVTLEDVEAMGESEDDEELSLGVGNIQDFSWKGLLDMYSCTECGRCQSQCPAWNTEKPLSPKLMIMALRDHAYGVGDYLLKGEDARASYDGKAKAEAERPLVGETEGEPWAPTGGGVIDPDVLWSCVTCGACVNQCPVDIEHVDHIIDMRRYQVLVESNFPAELNQLFRGMEGKGNPWNMSPNARMDWAQGLDFDVPVVGEDLESLESVDWLFWVGCAGAYEDRAKKTTRAVAELLNIAGVSFGVLGNGETCTGDSARRAGNEFVFQGLAQQNVEAFKEFKVKKVVSTCAHCFNTLKNEYKDFGIELEVVHHTQLLNRLVREGKLTPVADGAGAAKRSITYHDPCYIGRHNQVYEPPRELLQVLPGAEYVEMERSGERSFCCGAGGARMWMEETIGSRINVNRTTEAVGTGADQIAVGCPFCRVMLADGLTELQDRGEAREEVEVLDVAQMLLASVKGESATRARAGGSTAAAAGGAAAATALKERPAEPATEAPAEPAAAPASGGSLFDTPAPAEEKAADKPAAAGGSGGSLFDDRSSLFDTPAAPAESPKAEEPVQTEAKPAGPGEELESGGSLFDVAPTEAPAAPAEKAGLAEPAAEEPAPAAEEPVQTESKPAAPAEEIGSGSLFDLAAPEPAAPAEAKAEPAAAPAEPAEAEPVAEAAPAAEEKAPAAPAAAAAATGTASTPRSDVDIHNTSSLFDIEAPASETVSAPAAAAPAAEAPAAEPAAPVEEPAAEEPAAEESAAEAPAEPVAEAPSGAVDPAAVSGAFVDSGDAEAAPETTEDPETILDADDEPAAEEAPAEESAQEPAEPATADEPAEKPAVPAPAASGEAHTPRTDADIHNAESLFDL